MSLGQQLTSIQISAGTALLSVTDWEETATSAYYESDTWTQQQGYKHSVRVFGKIHKWALTCIEQNITWANSAVPYLYGLQSSGTSITLGSADPRRPITPLQTVVVAEVVLKISQADAAQNIRRFVVDFRQLLSGT